LIPLGPCKYTAVDITGDDKSGETAILVPNCCPIALCCPGRLRYVQWYTAKIRRFRACLRLFSIGEKLKMKKTLVLALGLASLAATAHAADMNLQPQPP